MREFGDNQVSHQCVGKGQQEIKPLPLLSFSVNFPSLRLGEMLGHMSMGIAEVFCAFFIAMAAFLR